MSEETDDKSIDRESPDVAETPYSESTLKEVEEIKEAVDATVSETSLPERVTDLHTMLENLSEEVGSWRNWQKTDYLEVIETLKSEVEEIQNEWNTVSSGVTILKERLESLLQSVPGVIETATLKALTMRVGHLEQLVSQLISESLAKESVRGTRRQYIISIVALAATIILWGVFIIMNLLK